MVRSVGRACGEYAEERLSSVFVLLRSMTSSDRECMDWHSGMAYKSARIHGRVALGISA